MAKSDAQKKAGVMAKEQLAESCVAPPMSSEQTAQQPATEEAIAEDPSEP